MNGNCYVLGGGGTVIKITPVSKLLEIFFMLLMLAVMQSSLRTPRIMCASHSPLGKDVLELSLAMPVRSYAV